MPPTPHHRIRVIAQACLDAGDRSVWDGVLDQECGDNHDLRDAVLHWLCDAADAQELPSTAYMGDGPRNDVWRRDDPKTRLIGSSIGPFRIVSHIASGGFGEIYLAEQAPVRRRVAVKVIKLGMDSAEVVARFEAERQALALMDHPHVARVIDGGTTGDGRPYFAMEYVDGIRLTRYCNAHSLPIRKRLELFIDVCSAVAHAHQKGIIHRDLKPSNVLVAEVNDRPMPKVIDFGIAKALGTNLCETPLRTSAGQLVGTPTYMSPEQARLPARDIDVRSDVYSLGVLLYELLVGTPPFSRRIIKEKGLDEMRRMVREVDPPWPSSRLASYGRHRADLVASQRCEDNRKLYETLRSELDWIVMRALEKDRDRRYQSASSLAADVGRFLDGQPLEARPPSLVYRAKKIARRHVGLLTTAAILTLAIFAAVVTSLLYALDAKDAREAAFRAKTKAERVAAHSRQLVYAGDMQLAGLAAQRNDIAKLRELLKRHIPQSASEPDLRGFEWYFLWKQIAVEPREVLRTDGPLYFVCRSPDSKLLATTGRDAVIRLIDSDTCQLIREISSGQGEVNGLAFSPDASQLASAGDDGSVRMWDVASGQLVWKAATGHRLAFQVAFTPDGKLVASCGIGNAVQFWDAATGEAYASLPCHESDIECLKITDTGLLVTGSSDESAHLLDLRMPSASGSPAYSPRDARQMRAIANQEQGAVSCIGVSADSRVVVFGQLGGLLTVYDVAEQALVYRHMFPDGIQSVAVSTGTATRKPALAVGDRQGNVHLLPFDLVRSANGAIATHSGAANLQTWQAHDGRIYSLAFADGGDRLVTAGIDGCLHVWDLGSQTNRGRKLTFGSTFSVVDDNQLVLEAKNLPVYDLRTGKKVRDLTDDDREWITVRTARRGNVIIGESRDGELFSWHRDGTSMGKRWQVAAGGTIGQSDVSDDGSAFLFVEDGPHASQLKLTDLAGDNSTRRLYEGKIGRVAISAHGKYVAFASDNTLHVVDPTSNRIIRKWHDQHSGIYQIEFSPDERSVATIAGDRTLKVHSIATGATRFSVLAHENSATSMAFSPDGLTIATAGPNGLLRLWRWRIGRLVLEIPTDNWPVEQIAFTPDGTRIIARESTCISVYDGSK